VPEPERDLAEIFGGLENRKRTGVAEDMRRYSFGGKGWASLRRSADMFIQDVLETSPGQRGAAGVRNSSGARLLPRTASHARSADAVSFHNGRQRSFRPFPWTRMLA
jgi:hypothetical protein